MHVRVTRLTCSSGFRWVKYTCSNIHFFTLFVCRRLEYTRDQLLEFKKHMDDKVGQGHGEEQGGGFGGFGGFGGGSSEVSFDISVPVHTDTFPKVSISFRFRSSRPRSQSSHMWKFGKPTLRCQNVGKINKTSSCGIGIMLFTEIFVCLRIALRLSILRIHCMFYNRSKSSSYNPVRP